MAWALMANSGPGRFRSWFTQSKQKSHEDFSMCCTRRYPNARSRPVFRLFMISVCNARDMADLTSSGSRDASSVPHLKFPKDFLLVRHRMDREIGCDERWHCIVRDRPVPGSETFPLGPSFIHMVHLRIVRITWVKCVSIVYLELCF